MGNGSTSGPDSGDQRGWSTRQLRAGLLVVMIFFVALFLVVRAPDEEGPGSGNGTATAPRPSAEADTPADTPVEIEPDVTPRRPRFELDASSATDVESALAAGDAALSEGRIFEPADDNALQHYLAVLEMDPDNKSAQEGLDAVVARLAADLEDAMARRAFDRADMLARVLDTAFSEEPAVSELLERLTSLERAERLLEDALEDIESDRLVKPPNRNALSRLREVKRLDPGHPELESAVMRFEERLVERALAAARKDRFAQAMTLIESASELRSDSALLADASQQITDFQDRRIDDVTASARDAMRSARFDLAVDRIAQVEALGAPSTLIERLREELAHARVYGNFAPGESFSDVLEGGGSGPEMIVLPKGSFLMGAAPGDDETRQFEEPRHRVRFARGFAMSIREISVEEFGRFVAASGYVTDAEREGFTFVYNDSNGRIIRRSSINWRHDYRGRPADHRLPVLHVSWNDAAAYARWLASATGQSYRLPTEAEFEYALRAGGYDKYWWGQGSPDRVVENLTGSEDKSPRYDRRWNRVFEGYGDGFWGPSPTGSFVASPYGLYDMAGNASEWVEDCWHDSYVRAPNDGSAWVNVGCEYRVVRGGFWGGPPSHARSAYRSGHPVDQRGSATGFRVARDLFVPRTGQQVSP